MRKGVPRYIRLLGNDDPEVRIAAAFVLSFVPEDVQTFGPALWERASSDPDDMVRANALIALYNIVESRHTKRSCGRAAETCHV